MVGAEGEKKVLNEEEVRMVSFLKAGRIDNLG
jgi:hypothetical protein